MPKIEITPEFLKQKGSAIILLYGEPGVGKSTLALTASKSRKVSYLDVEGTFLKTWGGMKEGTNDIKNLSYYTLKDSKDLIEDMSKDAKEMLEADVIIIDKITDLIKRTVMTKEATKGMDLKEWGIFKIPLLLFIEKCIEKNKVLIMLADEKENVKEKNDKYRPDCGYPSMTNSIKSISEFIGRIYITPTGERAISFSDKDGSYFAKNRGGCLPQEIIGEDVNMDYILNYYYADKRN